jgi:Domain of unknown function (DUF6391)
VWDQIEGITHCSSCAGPLTGVVPGQPFPHSGHAPRVTWPPAVKQRSPRVKQPKVRNAGTVIAPYLYLFTTIIFAGALALNPVGRFFIVPLIALVVIVCVAFLVNLIKNGPEMFSIFEDRRVRVTHGLEHACLAILREGGHETYGGRTSEGQFVVGIDTETSARVVERAAREAIRRFAVGDTNLAYSAQCGTSAVVARFLFAVVIVGSTIAGICFGVGAGPAFMAAAILGVFAQLIEKPLGLLAQRALTVSTQFTTARVGDITPGALDGEMAFTVPITVTL